MNLNMELCAHQSLVFQNISRPKKDGKELEEKLDMGQFSSRTP